MVENRVKLHYENQYENAAKLVETSKEAKVTRLWNKEVHNDRSIPNNKPDKVIRENEK
jgi:hypothetical protein